jgi:hypothetical protein
MHGIMEIRLHVFLTLKLDFGEVDDSCMKGSKERGPLNVHYGKEVDPHMTGHNKYLHNSVSPPQIMSWPISICIVYSLLQERIVWVNAVHYL